MDAFLSPDELKALQSDLNATPTTPTVSKDELRALGLDHSKFTANEYDKSQPDSKVNQNTYDQQGTPLMGVEGLPRTQSVTDESGRAGTEFVPAPPSAGPSLVDQVVQKVPIVGQAMQATDALFGQGTVDRTVGGAVTKAAKGVLGTAEWAMDSMQKNPAGDSLPNPIHAVTSWADSLLHTQFSDADNNYIDQHFATVAPNNPGEALAQEVGSFVITSAIGAKVATVADDAVQLSAKLAQYGLPQKALQTFTNFFNRAKKVDPASAAQKTQMFIHGLIGTVGANAGSVMSTPSDKESLSGSLGIIPEKLGPLSQEETNRVGAFVDNTLFSVGMKAASTVIGGAGRFIGTKLFGGGDRGDVSKVARNFFEGIDPNVTPDTTPQEVARRAEIFVDVTKKHSDFKIGLDGVENNKIQLDTPTALFKGAKEYVERAYGDRARTMAPDEYNTFVEKTTQDVVNRLINIKSARVNAGSQAISNHDAFVNQKASEALGQAADHIAPPSATGQAANALGQPIVDDLNSARTTLSNANANKAVADSTVDNVAQNNRLAQMIEEARAQNKLGDTTAEKDQLNRLSTNDLVNSWHRQNDEKNAAFAAIPRTQVPIEGLVESLKAAGDRTDVLDILHIPRGDGTIHIGDATPEVRDPTSGEVLMPAHDPSGDMVEQLRANGFDNLNTLITEIRPQIVTKINQLSKDTKANDISGLVSVKNWIDELEQTSNDPAVQRAFDAYTRFASNFLQTKPLQEFDAAMREVKVGRPMTGADGIVTPGEQMNLIPAQQAGFRALQSAISDPTNLEMPKFLAAIHAGNANANPELAQATLGMAIQGISRSIGSKAGQNMDSTTVINAVQPYLDTLQKTNPDIVSEFNRVVGNLQDAERGAYDAGRAQAAAKEFSDRVTADAKQQAAFKLIDESTGVPLVTGNAEATFHNIFNNKESVHLVNALMMKAEGNELATQGIQAEILRFARVKGFTSKPIGVGEGGDTFSKEVSTGRLSTMVPPRDAAGNFIPNNTLNTLRAAFKDKPQTADAAMELLDMLETHANLKKSKAFTGGSDTAINFGQQNVLKKNLDRAVRLGVGILNRTATILNTLTAAGTDGREARIVESINKIYDQLIVDPSFVEEAFKTLRADPSGVKLTAILGPIMKGGIMTSAKFPDKIDQQMQDNGLNSDTPTVDTQMDASGVAGAAPEAPKVDTQMQDSGAANARPLTQRPNDSLYRNPMRVMK